MVELSGSKNKPLKPLLDIDALVRKLLLEVAANSGSSILLLFIQLLDIRLLVTKLVEGDRIEVILTEGKFFLGSINMRLLL